MIILYRRLQRTAAAPCERRPESRRLPQGAALQGSGTPRPSEGDSFNQTFRL